MILGSKIALFFSFSLINITLAQNHSFENSTDIIPVIDDEGFVPFESEFRECCKEKGISSSCVDAICSYNRGGEAIFDAFINGTCDIDKEAHLYYQCHMNDQNMTDCCTNEIELKRHKDYEVCLELCDGINPVKYDKTYEKCFRFQSSINTCGIESRTPKGLGWFEPVTKFPIKKPLKFFGKVICGESGKSPDNAKVFLMESDNGTPDDELASSVITDGFFELNVNEFQDDGPWDDNLELYIKFQGGMRELKFNGHLCGNFFNVYSNEIINDTMIVYTIEGYNIAADTIPFVPEDEMKALQQIYMYDDPKCRVHKKKHFHILMDMVCYDCAERFSYKDPNIRHRCSSNCYQNPDFQSCLKMFAPKNYFLKNKTSEFHN